jgi:hypothetical protein
MELSSLVAEKPIETADPSIALAARDGEQLASLQRLSNGLANRMAGLALFSERTDAITK